ncbi:diiron oxygenase [Rhodococcus sp. NPDC058521]|uniref:AurF N-oxygenase family protein n=1 Tax=Rhodococcus sp. NPDC058521 TaxID=3346536 RepID=UPI00365A0681
MTVTDGEKRDRVASRLLKSSAEKFFDPEVDMDWDAPLEDGKAWLPEHRQSLYGTKLWDKLTPEQRIELGKQELASILSYAIYAECWVGMMFLRSVTEGDLIGKRSQYALTETGEEARHSTMFAQLLCKMGVEPYRQPKFLLYMFRFISFVPLGPFAYGSVMLVEEILDRAQREAMNDPTIQPHVRQVMRLHVMEEARHIAFARDEVRRGMESRGRIRRAPHRFFLALQAFGVFPNLVHPSIYRSVGINPLRGFIAARRGPHYKANLQYFCEPMARFFVDVGMYEGFLTKKLWRMSKGLPDDLI